MKSVKIYISPVDTDSRKLASRNYEDNILCPLGKTINKLLKPGFMCSVYGWGNFIIKNMNLDELYEGQCPNFDHDIVMQAWATEDILERTIEIPEEYLL